MKVNLSIQIWWHETTFIFGYFFLSFYLQFRYQTLTFGCEGIDPLWEVLDHQTNQSRRCSQCLIWRTRSCDSWANLLTIQQKKKRVGEQKMNSEIMKQLQVVCEICVITLHLWMLWEQGILSELCFFGIFISKLQLNKTKRSRLVKVNVIPSFPQDSMDQK